MPRSESRSCTLNETTTRQRRQDEVEQAATEATPETGHATHLVSGGPSPAAQASALASLDDAGRTRALHWLQQERGNAYVQRVVAEWRGISRRAQPAVQHARNRERPAGHYAVQRADLAVQRAPAALTQAGQEAEAAETMNRLRDIHRQMLRHSNRTVRNTGQLFSSQGGRPARLRFEPMTLRSDSATLVRTRGDNARETAYYFYGLTQNNEHRHGPTTIGTVDGNTILVRGRRSSGAWQEPEAIMGTFAHEASHILVSAYGEHPATETSASSFDRYKDEFRAYWIEPVGPWAEMEPNDDKAAAIRRHLVGTSATDSRAYPALRNRYWSDAAFKTQVDNHRRPDGFNLANNPNLDRLFQLLNGVRGGTSTVDDVLSHIVTSMSPAERAEAAASPLIQRLYRALGGEDSTRVSNALIFPRTVEHAGELNPSNSPRITALLEAIALRDDDAMKTRYQRLTADERGQIRFNAAVLVFIDRQITWQRQRASVYAMITGGRVDQFEAMGEFLDACMEAQLDALLSGLTEVPARVRSTLARLVYESRLALYRLLENVRRGYVDPLPNPVRGRILYALREGGEP